MSCEKKKNFKTFMNDIEFPLNKCRDSHILGMNGNIIEMSILTKLTNKFDAIRNQHFTWIFLRNAINICNLFRK